MFLAGDALALDVEVLGVAAALEFTTLSQERHGLQAHTSKELLTFTASHDFLNNLEFLLAFEIPLNLCCTLFHLKTLLE